MVAKTTPVVAKPLVVAEKQEVTKAEQVPDARILDEIRALKEQLQALQAALAQLQQNTERAENKGEAVEGVVTKNDPRRGKVYVPVSWVGKRVRVATPRVKQFFVLQCFYIRLFRSPGMGV